MGEHKGTQKWNTLKNVNKGRRAVAWRACGGMDPWSPGTSQNVLRELTEQKCVANIRRLLAFRFHHISFIVFPVLSGSFQFLFFVGFVIHLFSEHIRFCGRFTSVLSFAVGYSTKHTRIPVKMVILFRDGHLSQGRRVRVSSSRSVQVHKRTDQVRSILALPLTCFHTLCTKKKSTSAADKSELSVSH